MDPVMLVKLLRILALCGGVYVLFAVALFFLQGYLIFPASRIMDRSPSDLGLVFEEVRRKVQGHETYGWYVPLESHRGVVLFSHGNAGDLAGRLESISLLRSFGFAVLAYDYGGYGFSTGKPSEGRCYADIRSMWDYLTKERGVPPEQIVLFGRSLGAAPTADLAAEVTPGAVVLESAFLSTPDIAKKTWIFRPLTWLIRHRFQNKDKVASITAPLLIVHSPDDEIIPYAHGLELFARAPEPKTFLEIHGGHNIGFVLSERVYREGWDEFMTPILGPNPVFVTMDK